MSFRTRSTDLMLVVDVQRDFCEGGALEVPQGSAVVAPINRLMDRFAHVVATQDWHPADHQSFASAHSGRAPFETVEFAYGSQTLWPDHCVQGSPGAALHPDLRTEPLELLLRKGLGRDIDSYSAFLENDRLTPTGLAGYLRERGIGRIVCVGLALDFCVRWSAEDARRLGFETFVVLDATRAIDRDGSRDAALASLQRAGVGLLAAEDVVRGDA